MHKGFVLLNCDLGAEEYILEELQQENEIKNLLNKIEKLTMKKVHIISAVTKFGLDDLLSSIWNELGY